VKLSKVLRPYSYDRPYVRYVIFSDNIVRYAYTVFYRTLI